MNILFVFPSEREAASVRLRRSPLICDTGRLAGEVLAAEFTEARPDLVLLTGFCGALDPSLKPGSIILGRHVLAPGEDQIDPDRLVLEEIRKGLRAADVPFIYSRLLTVPAPAATKDEKRLLWNEYGAGGVDMETYWVADACRRARVNWLAVRVVLDTSRQNLPRSLASWEHPGNELATALEACKHPLEWPAYIRLASQYRAARIGLRRALPHVVESVRNARIVETLELV
jgi:adenosylhomocysteine nucleosidase